VTDPAGVESVAVGPVAVEPASVNLDKSDPAAVGPEIADAEVAADSDEHVEAGATELAAAHSVDPEIETEDAEFVGPEGSIDDAERATAESEDDHTTQKLVSDDATEDPQPQSAKPPVVAAGAAETAQAEGEPSDVTAAADQSDSERAEWAQWAERARAKWARWAEQGERADSETEATPTTNGGQRTIVGATDKGETNGGAVRPHELAGHHNGNGHKGSETATKT
jgi:hypothetical protein